MNLGQTTDILVIGSGIAGCAAALAAARKGATVTLVTKANRPDDATTNWAQGGIATTRGNTEALRRDIFAASDETADPDAVDVLVSDAADAVEDVLLGTLGIEFDTNDSGFDYAREAAHSEHRILHVKASTGQHILRPFLRYLDGHHRVTIRENTAALDLIARDGKVHGAFVNRARQGGHSRHGGPIFAGATILATGGIGACYPRSTNPPGATGDGIAMAALAGAKVEDMEYVQFHPTAYDAPDDDSVFLVSEAVRGEGAVLLNGDRERFMPGYHRDAELAPRDVVARAVDRERTRTGKVILDVSSVDFKEAFPDLAGICAEHGVDYEKGIPVAPYEHFLCGGIVVDTFGRTSLEALYAVGECARTGVHGANRLASTSLLEGLVWGLRAGENAAGSKSEVVELPELVTGSSDGPDDFVEEAFERLHQVMGTCAGLRRNLDDLGRAEGELEQLTGQIAKHLETSSGQELYELRNAVIVGTLVVRAARENANSVGCHYLETGETAALINR